MLVAPPSGRGPLPAMGNSDAHAEPQKVGLPQTVVLADDLSRRSLLEGIRAGRSYIAESSAISVGFTAIGTAIGGVLEDPNALGLDAAFAALFLALAVPYLRERRAQQAAALAAVITLVLTPFAPAGVPIIAASAACLLGLRRPAESRPHARPWW